MVDRAPRIVAMLAISVAACSKRDSSTSRTPVPAICDALLQTSLEARALREGVSAQFASVDHVLDRAERIRNKTLSTDEIGTDTEADARKRAFAYRQTGFALCHAANLLDEGMIEFAEPSLEGVDAGGKDELFLRTTCELNGHVDISGAWAASDRVAALAEWSSHSRDVRDFEDRLVQSCYNAARAKPTTFRTAPVVPGLLAE